LRYAFAFLHNRDLAEDVVQEALRRLYEHRDRYPLRTVFGPYLVKTVARICLDEKHARSRAHPRTGPAGPAPQEGPADLMERKELAAAISGAIRRLPERERACLLLVVCEGMTYRDAAEALSLSFHEVNNAVHRGRVSLRRMLRAVAGDTVRTQDRTADTPLGSLPSGGD
jgi:RNA polymerase sigma-70 factor (ECF subfamily)